MTLIPDDHAQAIALYATGITATEVSRTMGKPLPTICRWLKLHGIAVKSSGDIKRGKPWSAERRSKTPPSPRRAMRPEGAPTGYDILTARALGNVTISSHGYVRILIGRKKRQYEQILVAEKALGRKIQKGEVVHHINCIKTDNRPENLLVCTISYHLQLHARMRNDPYWCEVAAHAKTINREKS